MAVAQSAREEIRQNPALAAGKYYAYQAPDVVLTPAPDGYEPFYVSAFARHGSRYLTKEKKYAEPLAVLQAADKAGVLTADGKRTLQVISGRCSRRCPLHLQDPCFSVHGGRMCGAERAQS